MGPLAVGSPGPGRRRRLPLQRRGAFDLSARLASTGRHVAFLQLGPEDRVGCLNRAAAEAAGARFGECAFRALAGALPLDEGAPLAAAGLQDGANVDLIRCWSHSAVSTAADGTTKVWNVDSGACVLTLEGDGRPRSLAPFSPDGALRAEVAVPQTDTLHVLCTATGDLHVRLKGHAGVVSSARFSPDSKLVATASADGTARIWCLKYGTCLKTLVGHTASVNSAAFSSDCYYVVTASSDGLAKIWSVGSGDCLFSLQGGGYSVNSAAFSADCSRVLTGSDDRAVRAWSASNGTLLRVLEGHESPVTQIHL